MLPLDVVGAAALDKRRYLSSVIKQMEGKRVGLGVGVSLISKLFATSVGYNCNFTMAPRNLSCNCACECMVCVCVCAFVCSSSFILRDCFLLSAECCALVRQTAASAVIAIGSGRNGKRQRRRRHDGRN